VSRDRVSVGIVSVPLMRCLLVLVRRGGDFTRTMIGLSHLFQSPNEISACTSKERRRLHMHHDRVISPLPVP
jgi:hypothetical protein